MTKPSIPLGLVFSQSGPYAMMAGEMRKSALMAVDEINQSDEFDFTFTPHLRDPGGVVAGYHTACADLIREEHVDHIVGCYTSASRKQVIPDRRTDRAAALASGALRRVRKQRQRHLCRGRAQPARRAAGAPYAGPHLDRRVLHRVELRLDLGNEPRHPRNRDQRRRPYPCRTTAGTRRDRRGPHRQGSHRPKAAGRVQYAGW